MKKKRKVESEAKSITKFSTQTIKGKAEEGEKATATAEAAAAYWPEMYLAKIYF